MQAQGYAPAASTAVGDMVVRVDYGVDQRHDRISTAIRSPTAMAASATATRSIRYRGGCYGRPYYSRWGYYGRRSPFYYGWDDPFWSPFGYGRRRQLHRLQEPSRPRHSPPRGQCGRCSKAMPRRGRATTISARWCRTWSRRCSPASRAARARRCGSPSPPPHARALGLQRGAKERPVRSIRAGLFLAR